MKQYAIKNHDIPTFLESQLWNLLHNSPGGKSSV